MPRCSKCLETKRNQKVLAKMEEKKLGLFFCLLFSIVLVLQSGNAETVSEQQKKDLVTSLPGVSFNVSFSHYAGYVNVNESSGRWLFYWFIEAAEDPSSKPLVIWLEGGPGCSGLAFGQAVQIGPFRVTPDGKTLRLNPYSWNQVANIIFLEFPVGTGFSYSTNPSDVLTNGDKRTAEDSLVFLLKWFERFPQYKGRDFYIVGESYAGHYVPQLAQAIVRYQQSKSDKSINLKGYMVGNPLIDDFNDHTGFSQFWWSLGFISDQTYKLYNALCINESFFHRSAQCMNITSLVSSDVGNIDSFSIFTPPCTRNVTATDGTIKRSSKAELLDKKYDPCTENYAEIYFNLPEVQKALHVNPDAAPARWQLCSEVVDRNYKDSASTVLDIFHESISLGLRIWVYSGNADGIIPVTSTRYSINALKLPTSSPWRAWYDEGQVGGHTQEYVGLNFVTVLGAGHKVILTRPKFSLVLFKSFLAGTSMPSS